MTKTLFRLATASLLAVSVSATHATGQSLANRIASTSDRSVQFSYPVRPGVCGDGRTYISTGSGNFYGSFSSNGAEQCLAGPVRVVADLADRNIIGLRTYVGGPAAAAETGVTNLGVVTSADAADYLISVAARADGEWARRDFAAFWGKRRLTSR